MNEMTIGLKELAKILHVSEKTIRNRLSEAPQKLPPRLHLPDTRRPVWLTADVMAWLEKHREPPKRPGRPRKKPYDPAEDFEYMPTVLPKGPGRRLS